jgi:competence protein ComEA
MRRRATQEAWLNALLLLAIVAGLAVLILRSQSPGGGVLLEARDAAPGVDEIRVHVGGAVLDPSVVTVAPGARVLDAIELAGGFAPDADRDALNLSRRVVDEDSVIVPRWGEALALLDVNLAAASDFEALPGIGPVRAAGIVDEREGRGRFASTDDLVTRGVLPAHVYDEIRDLVTAR